MIESVHSGAACRWLHETLETLPLIRYPFDREALPINGVYFVYEEREIWGHGGIRPRIVRVGTHRDGNFRKRIAEHFLLDVSKMEFDATKPAPKDRSIFRKNIGRALLRQQADPYLEIWNVDLTGANMRKRCAARRDIAREKEIESAVTRRIRERFGFRVLPVDTENERLGTSGLERACIGTLAHCPSCRSSESWLGRQSPVEKIRNGKLWLVQHVTAVALTAEQQQRLCELLG